MSIEKDGERHRAQVGATPLKNPENRQSDAYMEDEIFTDED